MKKTTLLCCCVCILLSCNKKSNTPQVPFYLLEMIELAEENSINRNSIDWNTFRESVTDRVATAGTNEAIRLFLGLLGDNHSFYESGSGSRIFYSNVVCNDPEFNFVNIPEHVGYVRIGGFSGSVQEGINFANSVQQQIREADGAEVDAWIVDLSRNDGGNMYPMITGVSSLLKRNSVLGYFIDPEGAETVWGLNASGFAYVRTENNARYPLDSIYQLINPNPKIAVIMNGRTASSGEATAISFKGHPNTRFFGLPSCGLSTANVGYPLSNGGSLYLTVSTMADRNKQRFGGKVPVDEEFTSETALRIRVYEWLRQ